MTFVFKTAIGVEPGVRNLITWVQVGRDGRDGSIHQPETPKTPIATLYAFYNGGRVRAADKDLALKEISWRYYEIAEGISRAAALYSSIVAIDWSPWLGPSGWAGMGDTIDSALSYVGASDESKPDELKKDSNVLKFLPVESFIDDLKGMLVRSGLPEPLVEPGNSTTCAACILMGAPTDLGKRDREFFWCRRCRHGAKEGKEVDADVNAAHFMALYARGQGAQPRYQRARRHARRGQAVGSDRQRQFR